ncbi:hemagglutinin repeat-containing protein [Uliginosibacterium sp. sgz301328]|uniref:two-partner secretion domain-containing protein n=1 Tax=Uliginosibacterium sp. sgz301328 TaxID=3243764 RepID=UPI00359DD02D
MTDHHINRSSNVEPAPRTVWSRHIARAIAYFYLAHCTVLAVPAAAQVSAAAGSSAGTKPLMDAAANGVPIVNIAPPSSAGVSHNQYDQFNVGKPGLILNNAGSASQSQLGGWINGNPQLGQGGGARIILNEVTSGNASQLGGAMEVAGRRADVVIANPNGITCDGCGFINTGRATLVTGSPQFGAGGALTGFSVGGGRLLIGAQGLDGTSLEQLDLIARGLTVAGEVWTQRLNAVTGTNLVQYADLQVTRTDAVDVAPSFAIDIRDMGGMYANQIYMVATEAGLGVNSTGRMAALQDNLRLSSAGELTLADVYSKGDLTLDAAGQVTLNGQTWSDRTARINSAAGVRNAGELVGDRIALSTPTLDNTGSVIQQAVATLGVDVDTLANRGTLASGGALNVRTRVLDGEHGTFTAQGDVALGGDTVSLAGARIGANGVAGIVTPGALSVAGAVIDAQTDVKLGAGGAIDAQGAQIYSGGRTDIAGASLDARAALISAQQSLSVRTPGAVDNSQGGQLLSNNDVSIDAASINNTGGTIGGNGVVTLKSAQLVNDRGLVSGNTVDIGATGAVTNRQGTMSATDVLTLQASRLDSTGGLIVADGAATLAVADTLDNTQGFIQGRSLRVEAARTLNTDGVLLSESGLDLTAAGSVDNTRGVVQGDAITIAAAALTNTGGGVFARNVALSAQRIDNTGGEIVADENLSIEGAQGLTNAGGLLQGNTTRIAAQALDNTAGQIVGVSATAVDADALTNAGGVIAAVDGQTNISAGNIDNTSGLITGHSGTTVTAASLTNSLGEVSSNEALSLQLGTGTLTNHGGQIIAGSDAVIRAGAIDNDRSGDAAALIQSIGALDLRATSVDNHGDSLIWSEAGLALAADALDNSGGQIGSSADAQIDATRFANAAGVVYSQTLSLTSDALDNSGGYIGAAQTIQLASTGRVVNDAGSIQAEQVSIQAQGLSNVLGNVTGTSAATLSLGSGALDNTRGTIVGQEQLSIDAARITNDSGTIGTTGDLALVTRDATLINTAGYVLAGGALTVEAAAIDNTNGVMAATAGDVSINTQTGAIANLGGALQAAGTLEVSSGDLDNSGGVLYAQDQTLRVGQLSNDTGGQIVATRALDIHASGLANDAGLIQSVAQMELDVSGTLTNANSGNVGGIFAGTDLTVRAGTLENNAGVLSAHDALDVNVAGGLTNTGLMTSSGSAVVHASELTNTGTIGASEDVAITVDGTLRNATNGALISNARLTLAAARVDNSGGAIDGQDLDIRADALANAGGQIRANTDAMVDVAALDNSNGLISAANDLTVQAPALTNEQGQLMAGRVLDLHTREQGWGGTTAAGDLLALTVDGDYRNTGTLSSENSLSITARNVENSGKITATDTLTVTTGDLTNSGEIAADETRLNVSGTLTNTSTGLIDGRVTHIEAGTLDNTGRIYGDWIEIGAGTVNNIGPGVIAAREELNLGARQINNSEGALIYSLGAATLGGQLDDNGYAVGKSQSLVNASARIEAARELAISTDALRNVDTHITTRTITTDPVEQVWIRPDGDGGLKAYPADLCFGVGSSRVSCIVHPEKYGLRTEVAPVYTTVPGNCYTGSEGDERYCDPDTYTLNYAWDSGIFARFGVTPLGEAPPPEPDGAGGCTETYYDGESDVSRDKNSTACNQWRDDYAGWRDRYEVVLQELIPIVDAYNAEVHEDNRTTDDENYRIERTIATESHTEVDSAAPAQILSGGDMFFTGSGVNENSQIVAGGGLYMLGGSIENRALQGLSTTTFEGSTSQHFWVENHGVLGGHQNKSDDPQPMVRAPVVVTTELASFRFEQNAADPTQARQVDATDRTATPVNAHEAGTLTVLAANTANITSRAKDVTSSKAVKPDYSLPSFRVVDAAPLPDSEGKQSASKDIVVAITPKVQLPTSNLFVIHAEPDSKYLVETDPRFTNYRTFLSSDYFFTQLQVDPLYQMKRYGDGFYEQQQINDQILALTGRKYLSGYTDTEAEYAALMDAGSAFSRQYQLTPGVALSAEQMAMLTTDIVWFVAQAVTLPDGSVQNVLVPQVYLRRPKDGDLGTGGALLAGDAVFIKTDSELVNSGRLAANGAMTLLSDGDITNAGGRISANDIYARAENDLKNLSGVITGTGVDSRATLLAGRDIVIATRTLDSASEQGTRTNVDRIATVHAGQVYMKADRDLVAEGARVTADTTLQAYADRNIKITSVEGKSTLDAAYDGNKVQGRGDELHETSVTQYQSVFKAGTNANIVAKDDVLISGSTVKAGGNIGIQGTNVAIEAKKDSYGLDVQSTGMRSYNRSAQYDESIVGGEVAAGGNILIRAKSDTPGQGSGDIRLTGAYIHNDSAAAGEEAHKVSVIADNDLTIEALKTTHSRESEQYSQSTNGFGKVVIGVHVADDTVTNTRGRSATWETAEGSLVSGQTVELRAGSLADKRGDITISGSQVVADEGLTVIAGRNLNIVEMEEGSSQTAYAERLTHGMFSNGGAAATFGTQKREEQHDLQSTGAAGSLVGSNSGNVILIAGDTYTQRGSVVTAAEGDVLLDARRGVVEESRFTSRASDIYRTSSNGLTLSVSSPVLDVLMTAQQMSEDSDRSKGDARTNALAAATVAMSAYNAGSSLQGTSPGSQNNGGAGATISLTYGSSHSQSKQEASSDTAQGSAIKAGGNFVANIHGGGDYSDLRITGTDVTAGGKVRLYAEDELIFNAAQNTMEQHSTNSSSSAGVGVAATVSQNGMAFGITANASAARGKADGSDLYYTNTHIAGGQGVEFTSGGNTTIAGATISGEYVKGNVGGELFIESLQDTSSYKSSQQSAGGSVTFGYGFSASGSYSQSDLKADYASVTEQSGIFAGSGGYQIDVAGGTHLKGGAIVSDAEAEAAGRNSLVTDTLQMEDIQNRYNVSGMSVGLSGGYGSNTGSKNNVQTFNNSKSGSATFVVADEKESSTTYSVISDGNITIRNDAKQQELTGKTADETVASVNHDAANALNSLTNSFDADAVQAKMDVATAFQQQAHTLSASLSIQAYSLEDKAKALEQAANNAPDDATRQQYSDQAQQAKDEAEKYRYLALGVSAFSGAAGANVLGGMDQLITNATVNFLQGLAVTEIKQLADSYKDGEKSTTTSETIRTVMQGITACAGAAASGQSCAAGAAGAATSVVLNLALNELLHQDVSTMTPEEKQNRSDLITGIVGMIGVATGNADLATTGSNAAQLETDNNQLSTRQSPSYISEFMSVLGGKAAIGLRKDLNADEQKLLADTRQGALAAGLGATVSGNAAAVATEAAPSFLAWQAGMAPVSQLTVGSVGRSLIFGGATGTTLYVLSKGLEATPAGVVTAFGAGAIAGPTKYFLNYSAGLANTIVPYSVGNLVIQVNATALGTTSFKVYDYSGATSGGTSWWTSPIFSPANKEP